MVEGEQAEEMMSGVEGIIVLDKTPFYAEMGGQVADHGVITCGDAKFEVADVQKNKGGKYMHTGKVVSGSFKLGDTVTASIDVERRKGVRRAHTATHLLDAALKHVLGDHVHQAGSLVEPDRLRFDFTHFEGITPEQLAAVDAFVNDAVLEGIPVVTEVLPIEEAKKKGAVAMFGEKYGDVVRVVEMGNVSVEFCGGTHLDNTAKVGLFRIKSEGSVASGVRRIEAITGKQTLAEIRRNQERIVRVAQMLKTTQAELESKLEAQIGELKDIKAKLEKFKEEASLGEARSFLTAAKTVGSLKVITAQRDGMDPNAMRKLGDFLRDKEPGVVGVLASVHDGKVTLLAVCGKDAVAKGVKAGDILNTTGTAVSTYVVVSIVRSAGAVTQVGVVKLGEAVTVYALKADTTYKKVALVDETALKAATPSYWKVDARDYGFGNPGNGNWTAYRQGSSEEADIFGDCRVGDIVELESMDDTVNAVIVSKHESVITLCAQTAGPQSSYTHLLYNIWDDGTIDAFIPQEKLKATDDVTVDGGISITDSARRQVFSDLWKDAVGMVDYKDHPTKPYEHDGAWFTYDEARAEFNKIKFPRSHALTLALGDNSEGTWSGAALTDIRQGDVLTWTDANGVNLTASVITGYTTDSAGYACALFANDGDIYIEFNLLWLLSNGNAYAVPFPADSVVWAEMAKLQKRLADTTDVVIESETNTTDGLYVTDSAKRAVFVDMWNNRCKYGNDEHVFGGYLPDEAPDADHPFLLNKIWMTYADAVQTWMLSHNQLGRSSNEGLFGGYGAEAYEKYSKCKTYFPIYCGMSYSAPSLVRAFKGNRIVETLSFVNGYGVVLGINAELQGAFDGCWNLREILSEIRSPTAFDNYTFRECRSLTEIRISRLLYDVCFADSPLLSLASFQYLVTNAANTSAITVTVHADVFAKLTGDMTNEAAAALTDDEKAAWAAVLEAACAKNISFAAA